MKHNLKKNIIVVLVYYLFCRIYNLLETPRFKFGPSDFKAGIVFVYLYFMFFTSLLDNITCFFPQLVFSTFSKFIFVLIGITDLIIVFRIYLTNDDWKQYNLKFKRLDKNIKLKYDLIIFSYIIFSLVNFFHMHYIAPRAADFKNIP